MRILSREQGPILDVGGGAAPHCRAAHVVDVQPYSASRLAANAWGTDGPEAPAGWPPERYTQLDLCAGLRWPFADRQFDLGPASHCLEDLRDPLPAVRELGRVARRVLVIAPSRLLEQTRGIDHPAYCGFSHHPWMVYAENGDLVFRRKTTVVETRGCHLACPPGTTLAREAGSMHLCGEGIRAREEVFWAASDDAADCRRFLAPFRGRRGLFVADGREHSLKYWVWKARQMYWSAW
jgi:SAM-dependent methyltransferase